MKENKKEQALKIIKPLNLLPCPFCGGKAEKDEGFVWVAIRCSDCLAKTKKYFRPVAPPVMERYSVDIHTAIEVSKIIGFNYAAEKWNSRMSTTSRLKP